MDLAQAILLAVIVVILCFGFVVLFGPPYVPTLSPQARLALDMIDLKSGDTLLELGSGDGKILLAAARRGWNAVGIELNPILVVVSRLRTWRYRKQVKIRWGNFWQSKHWPQVEGIFVFILPQHMTKLDNKITQWHTRPVKLVSFAFTIPDKKTIRQHKSGVYLYEYK
jgi:hypothetical protein